MRGLLPQGCGADASIDCIRQPLRVRAQLRNLGLERRDLLPGARDLCADASPVAFKAPQQVGVADQEEDFDPDPEAVGHASDRTGRVLSARSRVGASSLARRVAA